MSSKPTYLQPISVALARTPKGSWSDAYGDILFATPEALDEADFMSARAHHAHDNALLVNPREQDGIILNGFLREGQRWDQIATINLPYEDEGLREVILFMATHDQRRESFFEVLRDTEQPFLITDRPAYASYCLLPEVAEPLMQEDAMLGIPMLSIEPAVE